MKIWTSTLDCFFECGSQITISSPDKRCADYLYAMAEVVGWTSIDVGKKQDVVCPSCIKKAQLIVKSVGMGKKA